ncbi:dUTPase, partial [Parageobacillus thermantarcticus]
MNIKKLFELQKQLDLRIEKEHPRKPGEDRLAKKILALMVELGELANEARFFKYWSHDQAPRTKIEYICPTCNGTGDENYDSYIDDLEGGYTHEVINCEDCGGTGTLGYKNPLLEEYVDCLHFILSIGNDINMNEVYEDYEPKPLYFGDGDI